MVQKDHAVENENSSSEDEDDEDLVAGIFQTRKNKLKKSKNALFHSRDCSKVGIEKDAIDVALDEIRELIKDCFVTGKWAEGEDAEALLKDYEGKIFNVFFYYLEYSLFLIIFNRGGIACIVSVFKNQKCDINSREREGFPFLLKIV